MGRLPTAGLDAGRLPTAGPGRGRPPADPRPPREKPARARALYVEEALGVAQIAERMGAGERTVSRWKADAAAKGDDWDKARVAGRMTKESIETATQSYLEQFLTYQRDALAEMKANTELTTLEKVAAITSLTDAYVKGVRACALTAPALNQLGVAIEVLQRLAAFIQERHPEVAPNLLAILEPFGQELAKFYG